MDLSFDEDLPKELTQEMIDESLHYRKINHWMFEQNQYKFIYSAMHFPTEVSRNKFLSQMEVEMDDHVSWGSIFH